MSWTNLSECHLPDGELRSMTKEQLAAHIASLGRSVRASSKPDMLRQIAAIYKADRREDARQRALDKIGV